MKRQRKLFTNFCNAKLADRDDVPPVTDLFEDIKDGRLLYALLEELSGQSLAPLGRVKAKGRGGKPLTRIDHVANLSISFRYIKQTTKVVGIGPGDVADGNPGLVLGLLWSIIVFFTAKDLGGVDDISALKKKILKWCQKRTENNDDVDVRNLKDSFMGGRAFLAILNDVDPGFQYDPDPNGGNFKKAFEEASTKYNVPELLDGDDEDCWKDEQAMVTYLSEMMKRLPEKAEDLSPGVIKYVDDNLPQSEDDLRRICAKPDCLADLEDIANRDGLTNVEVVDNFVLASSQKFDKALPTLLFVADYGVDLSLEWRDPEDSSDKRGLKALSAVTKAGVLSSVKALAALTAAIPEGQRPPVNVEILLCKGHDGLESFVASKYDGNDRPIPHYALVDSPGNIVAPEKFTTAFACRGELNAEISVRMARGGGGEAEDDRAAYVRGPLLDANLVLANVASQLRKPSTAGINIPLKGFPEPNRFTKAVSNVNVVAPAQFAQRVGYTHRLATLSNWSLVEQLCFHPGLTVVKVGGEEEEKAFPGSGRAVVFANLAPAFSADDGLAAFRTIDAPWGAELEISGQGKAGFLTELATDFLGKMNGAVNKRFKERGAALAASPVYLPLVTAVANGLPKVATYGCGVSDPKANLATTEENVQLVDFANTIKTFVQIVLDLKGLQKQSKGKVDPTQLYQA